jgi:hypothetical protein
MEYLAASQDFLGFLVKGARSPVRAAALAMMVAIEC